MHWLLLMPLRALLALRRSHSDLALENLALRHQLHVALRTNPRPRLRHCDRIFWVWLRRLWPGGWRQQVSIVRPETVIGECLDHMIVTNERHLHAVLTEFIGYYNHERPHRTLSLQMPVPRSA
jgi:transposase InsO family protein